LALLQSSLHIFFCVDGSSWKQNNLYTKSISQDCPQYFDKIAVSGKVLACYATSNSTFCNFPNCSKCQLLRSSNYSCICRWYRRL